MLPSSPHGIGRPHGSGMLLGGGKGPALSGLHSCEALELELDELELEDPLPPCSRTFGSL